MPDSDAPALNDDGTLKDATEIEWLNSLSDESRPATRKRKRSDSSAQQTSDTEDNLLPGLKNKAPARKVSGKRVPKLSDRAGAGAAFQSPKSHKFFQSKFIRGEKKPTNAAKFKPERKCANSAPPSPEKGSVAKVATSTSKPRRPTTSKPKTRVIESDDKSDSRKEVGNEVDEAEDEVAEDPLEKYEKMKEEIQRECMPPRKHFHRGEDPRTQDLRVMFTPGEIRDKAMGKVKKGHFCKACIAKGYRWDHAFLKGANSTLHTHISRRWSSHGNMYIQRCRELEIAPNQCALPKQKTKKLEGLPNQMSVDSFVETIPNVKWS